MLGTTDFTPPEVEQVIEYLGKTELMARSDTGTYSDVGGDRENCCRWGGRGGIRGFTHGASIDATGLRL